MEGCFAKPVGVGTWNTQGACLSIIGVCWGLRILLGYSEGLRVRWAGFRCDCRVSGLGKACCLWGQGLRIVGILKSLEPGCLGIPAYTGAPGMEWMCSPDVTVVTSRVCDCYLSEPGAGIERHEIGLYLTELSWLCEHPLNILVGSGGLTGNSPRIHMQFSFC